MAQISMIGAGNLASHLSLALQDAGHEIVQLFSRTANTAAPLAQKLNCSFTTNLKELKKSDLAIIAVSDDVISEVASQIALPMVHTSGTKGMEILNKNGICGVFYPLQTFSKNKEIDFQKIPICIEASNKKFEKTLTEIAKSISKNIYLLNSEQRKHLHLSAVMACNFSNLMYTFADEICQAHEIPFKLLKPLIEETANKIQSIAPTDAQTGPASRKDLLTIERHLNHLNTDLEKKEIYQTLTQSILKRS